MDELSERVRSIIENEAEVTDAFRLEEITKVLDRYEKYNAPKRKPTVAESLPSVDQIWKTTAGINLTILGIDDEGTVTFQFEDDDPNECSRISMKEFVRYFTLPDYE